MKTNNDRLKELKRMKKDGIIYKSDCSGQASILWMFDDNE